MQGGVLISTEQTHKKNPTRTHAQGRAGHLSACTLVIPCPSTCLRVWGNNVQSSLSRGRTLITFSSGLGEGRPSLLAQPEVFFRSLFSGQSFRLQSSQMGGGKFFMQQNQMENQSHSRVEHIVSAKTTEKRGLLREEQWRSPARSWPLGNSLRVLPRTVVSSWDSPLASLPFPRLEEQSRHNCYAFTFFKKLIILSIEGILWSVQRHLPSILLKICILKNSASAFWGPVYRHFSLFTILNIHEKS